MRTSTEHKNVGGYGMTSQPQTCKLKGAMGWTALSTAATSMLTPNHYPTSMTPRAFRTTDSKYSFQSLGVANLSTEPWEKWVIWDLPQKSTGSGPTGSCRKAYTNNALSLKLSFYVQKSPTLSLLTTLPVPEDYHTLGNKYSSFPQKKQHLSANNIPSLLPQLAFPQSPLAKALLTGLIPLRTYKGRLASHAATTAATICRLCTAFPATLQATTPTTSVPSLASGVMKTTCPPSVRTCT
jgi:hypothetical protein